MKPITISEAVDELRSQIIAAQGARQDDNTITFEIVEAELQIQGSFTRSEEANASGSVKFSVFGFGAEAGAEAGAQQSAATAHTVTLRLNVNDKATGGRAEISADTDGDF